jgi:hypothetical protein
MEIRRQHFTSSTIEDFAKANGLTMVVKERSPKSEHPRYCAQFEDVEIKDGVMLTSAYGNGETEEEAIEAYSKDISGETIVLKAYKKGRLELVVPLITT